MDGKQTTELAIANSIAQEESGNGGCVLPNGLTAAITSLPALDFANLVVGLGNVDLR